MCCERWQLGDSVVHVMMGGPDREIVAANGKRYRFEMHPHFGPCLLTPTGQVATNQYRGNKPFWAAVSLWAQQGEKIVADGLCAWKPEPRPVLEHIGGRHYRVVG
jgi:hypothetical protein